MIERLYAMNCPECGTEWTGRDDNEWCPACGMGSEVIGAIENPDTIRRLLRDCVFPYIGDDGEPQYIGVTPEGGFHALTVRQLAWALAERAVRAHVWGVRE